MDTAMRTTSVQQRAPTKKTKPKKKNTPHPVKVVYISNPMKIKTSASEFRALVQELTGQDAQSPPNPTRFHALDSSDDSSSDKVTNVDDHFIPLPKDPNNSVQHQPQPSSSFEAPDDHVFTPQMIDSISSLLPASLFYESPHLNYW
ncbi:sigma factor binding protein 2, chloroplastic [Vigna radiata var. radiata]|uniref:Sigma factor binding protein 2, chloroplastic n=1 Tax=Vigna radiata var. radiata TaxID=3916 RepID=A0A1S3T7K5_VIGRR|nr:sigma factor binding protein 2, chloroplastic [Vigna radiata var. radiata]